MRFSQTAFCFFTQALSGEAYSLTHEQVTDAMRDVLPEPIQKHIVVIGGRDYPIEQVLAQVLHLSKLDFNTVQARNIVKRLGFEVRERRYTSRRIGYEKGNSRFRHSRLCD